MGRRKLPKKERRSEMQNTPLRPEEMRQLERAAKRAAQSRSSLVRSALKEYLEKQVAVNA